MKNLSIISICICAMIDMAYAANLHYMPLVGDKHMYRYNIEEDEVHEVAEVTCSPAFVECMSYDGKQDTILVGVHNWLATINAQTGDLRCREFNALHYLQRQPLVDARSGLLYSPVLLRGENGVRGAVIDIASGEVLKYLFDWPFSATTACFAQQTGRILYWAQGGIKSWDWQTGAIGMFQEDPRAWNTIVCTYLGLRGDSVLVYLTPGGNSGPNLGRLESTSGHGYTVLVTGMDGEAVLGSPAGERFVAYSSETNRFCMYDFAAKTVEFLDVRESILAGYPEEAPPEVFGLLNAQKITYHTADGRYLVLGRGNTARDQSAFSVYDLEQKRWSRIVPVGNAQAGGVAGFVSWVAPAKAATQP